MRGDVTSLSCPSNFLVLQILLLKHGTAMGVDHLEWIGLSWSLEANGALAGSMRSKRQPDLKWESTVNNASVKRGSYSRHPRHQRGNRG